MQASEAEIRAALVALHAFELGGSWRLLAPAYALETFRLVLNTAIMQALAQRDAEAARQRMQEHFSNGLEAAA